MTNPTELLPRPFCGGDELSHGYDNAGIYQSVVRCHADDCGAAIVLVGQSEGDAIAAWNTRAAPAPVASEEVERVRDTLAAMSAFSTDPDPRSAGKILMVHFSRRHTAADRQAILDALNATALSLTTPARAVSREKVESGIRIAIWNAAKNRGMGQDAAIALVSGAMVEPAMVSVLALIGGGE